MVLTTLQRPAGFVTPPMGNNRPRAGGLALQLSAISQRLTPRPRQSGAGRADLVPPLPPAASAANPSPPHSTRNVTAITAVMSLSIVLVS